MHELALLAYVVLVSKDPIKTQLTEGSNLLFGG